MKRFLVLVLLIISAMPLFAAGKAESEAEDAKLILAVWGNYLGDEMPGLIGEFESRNPGTTVEVVRVAADSWSDYFTKIRTLIAGGNGPDAMYVAVEGARYIAASGLGRPVDDLISTNPEAQKIVADLHPRLQSAFEIDGKTYGTVFGWNNVVMHFNLDMLDAAGLKVPSADWDYNAFIKYAKALTRDVDGKKIFAISTPAPTEIFVVSGWLYSFGASILNDEWTASALDTPEALEAFQALYDLIYKYKVAPAVSASDQSINQFINEQVAMVRLGRWALPAWESNNINFDIQYMPGASENQVIFGSGAFVVSESSKNPEEAFKLTSFLSSPWSQKTAIGLNTIPASISVMDEVLPSAKPANTMLFRESADIAKSIAAPEQFPEIAQIFSRYYSLMMANEMPVKEAVAKMHAEINAALTK
jgi:ABC-type glycerol-3-phosphate transport system substrate-binding protein